MTLKLSNLYEKEIYTAKGKYLGPVRDVIVDFKNGRILRLTLESLKSGNLTEGDASDIIRYKSIDYKDVTAVGDVVVVKRAPGPQEDE